MDGQKKKKSNPTDADEKHSNKSSEHDHDKITFGGHDVPVISNKNKLSDKEAHRSHRHHKKLLIIYPEDTWKNKWDILISVVLIISCLSTPIELAFYEE